MKCAVNNSFIYYHEKTENNVNNYYQYIFILFKNILENNNNIKLNIILGQGYPLDIIDSDNKIIRIGINYEHTLVKPGGRDSENSPTGNIKIENSDNYYLVRLDQYNSLKECDIVIDYSYTNIINIIESSLYEDYSKKLVYISPYLYCSNFTKSDRTISTLTTFINIHEPRRAKLLEMIKDFGIDNVNINNCFGDEALMDLYRKTKIIINIHQTDHHDTFEELRVLPALLCGIIVICENSPLKEFVPYNKFVIWADYDNIVNTVDEVSKNYDYYHKTIFENDTILSTLEEIKNDNYINLYNKLSTILT